MRRAVLLLVLLGVLPACAATSVATAEVTLDEFSITVDTARWKSGTASLQVENYGDFPHTLVVTSSEGTVVFASPVLSPEEDLALELDLQPGAYQLTCRIVAQTPDGTIIDHYEQGMRAAIEVGA